MLNRSVVRTSLLLFAASLVLGSAAGAAPRKRAVASKPAPAVTVPGSQQLSLEEFKSSAKIAVKSGQSRLFRLNNKVTRTCISDPVIAEPVVISENQFFLLGKRPGKATFTIWNAKGEMTGVDIETSQPVSAEDAASPADGHVDDLAKSAYTAFPAMVVANVAMEECKMTPLALAEFNKLRYRGKGHGNAAKFARNGKPAAPTAKNSDAMNGTCPIIARITMEPFQMRTFRCSRKIVDTSLDSNIADVVLISDNDMQILSKAPGTAVLKLLDDAHNLVGVEITSRQSGPPDTDSDQNDAIPPVVVTHVRLTEFDIDNVVNISVSKPKVFAVRSPLVRTSVSDADIAQVLPGKNSFYLVGKKAGTATVFLWDKDGGVSGIDVHVSDRDDSESTGDMDLPPPGKGAVPKVECWEGDKMDIVSCP